MSERIYILIVDDEKDMRDTLLDHLVREGYNVDTADGGEQAIELAKTRDYDLVITDLIMPGVDGMQLLEGVKGIRPHTPVIMMTAFGKVEDAVEAMKLGAFDYITKPFKIREMLIVIRKALDDRKLKEENILLKREVEKRYHFANILGKSPAMQKVFDLIERVALSSSTVLVIGDSGTGKELVARAIHYNGSRRNKPFVPINCTAIPEGLLESELFGHVKGSFTGADVTKKGLFERANGGTLFLDEIGDMGMGLQGKLLRVLQDREIRSVGGTEVIKVDARVISATNKDLEEEISQKRFRDDLFYRLNVIPIHLPSLKDRRDDIPLLVEHFLHKYVGESSTPVRGISPEAMQALIDHQWKGNVRELENVIERAVVLARHSILTVEDLPQLREVVKQRMLDEAVERRLKLEEVEDLYIERILEVVQGNKKRAAEILGINRRTLYRRKVVEKPKRGEPAERAERV